MDICRWHSSPDVPGGRFLVPGCWNRVVGGDDAECQCPKPPKSLPAEARGLIEALAAIGLDDEQVQTAWEYLGKVSRHSRTFTVPERQ